MNLTPLQVFIFLCDASMEALWPLSLIITLDPETNQYPYDPFVMQAWSGILALLVSYIIDFFQQNCVWPSWNIAWTRWYDGAISATILGIGNILLIVGFRTATSGATATIGFMALPMYILIEVLLAILKWDLEELVSIRYKLSGISPEILLIIGTCSYLFILQDEGSQVLGVIFLLLGRFCICIKSYMNERSVLKMEEGDGTISSATVFLFCNAVMMYLSSQPMTLLETGSTNWSDLIYPRGWEWITLIPFFAEFGIHTTNILVETQVGGEMHTIAGTFGRIAAMYVSFTYDVTPTVPLVLSVLSITFAVIAYLRLHYQVHKKENKCPDSPSFERKFSPYLGTKIRLLQASVTY